MLFLIAYGFGQSPIPQDTSAFLSFVRLMNDWDAEVVTSNVWLVRRVGASSKDILLAVEPTLKSLHPLGISILVTEVTRETTVNEPIARSQRIRELLEFARRMPDL